VHGRRDKGEDLCGGVAPLVDGADVGAVEVGLRQLVGEAQTAGADAVARVVEREDAELLVLVEAAKVPPGHAVHPRVNPLRPVGHVDEHVVDVAPLEELVHDSEPVSADAAFLDGQDAVVDVAQALIVLLGGLPVDGDLGHGDHFRIGLVVEHAVVVPGAEDVVGVGRVGLDPHAGIADEDRGVDLGLVDVVVPHVLGVVEGGAEVPLLFSGELILGL